jgi:hypothetical protein
MWQSLDVGLSCAPKNDTNENGHHGRRRTPETSTILLAN